MAKVYLFPVEEMVLNPSALPEELRDWRYYRLEYGGVNEYSIMTCGIWLPPTMAPEEIIRLIEMAQKGE